MTVIEHDAAKTTVWAIGVLAGNTAPVGRQLEARRKLNEIAARADAAHGAVDRIAQLEKTLARVLPYVHAEPHSEHSALHDEAKAILDTGERPTLDQVRAVYPPMDELIARAEDGARRVEQGFDEHERGLDYYRGVADAIGVVRAHDFPLTERADLIAEKLAPSDPGCDRAARQPAAFTGDGHSGGIFICDEDVGLNGIPTQKAVKVVSRINAALARQGGRP